MSKRALKKYLGELDKDALQEQLMDLYDRFPEVKTYYDFVFSPNEEKLLKEATGRIAEEYFPQRRKRAKARRSVAQKYIKHFRTLGVDPQVLAEVMAFNLETALRFERHKRCPEAFFRSMYKSYVEWGNHLVHNGLFREHLSRVKTFTNSVQVAGWPNREVFADYFDQLNT
jgi:hypothetical protein